MFKKKIMIFSPCLRAYIAVALNRVQSNLCNISNAVEIWTELEQKLEVNPEFSLSKNDLKQLNDWKELALTEHH